MGGSKAVSEGIHSVTTFASPLLFPLDGAGISFPNFGFVFVSFSRFGRSFWHDRLGGVGGRAGRKSSPAHCCQRFIAPVSDMRFG